MEEAKKEAKLSTITRLIIIYRVCGYVVHVTLHFVSSDSHFELFRKIHYYQQSF